MGFQVRENFYIIIFIGVIKKINCAINAIKGINRLNRDRWN